MADTVDSVMVPLRLHKVHLHPANLALLASHQDLQVLLDPEPRKALLDLVDLVNLDLLVALDSPVLLKAQLVQVALLHQDSQQDLQVLLPQAAHKLLISLKFQDNLPAHKTTLLLLQDHSSSKHQQVQLVLLDLANQVLLLALLVLRIHKDLLDLKVLLALELLPLHKHPVAPELLHSLALLKVHKVLQVQLHLVALLVLNSPKVLLALRPQSHPLVLKVLLVLDSQVLLPVLPPQVHHLLLVPHKDQLDHKDPTCPLLQANQALLKDPQALNNPKDPVCPHLLAHLLNHLDLKDQVLHLDLKDLALLLLLYHLRVLKDLVLLKCLVPQELLRDLVLLSDRDSLVHLKDQVDLKLHSHLLDLKDLVLLHNHLDHKDLVLLALLSHLLNQADQLLLQDP